ncbi:MAG: GC-type dockerin domain-anchored protein [Planctomycetota bacterium]
MLYEIRKRFLFVLIGVVCFSSQSVVGQNYQVVSSREHTLTVDQGEVLDTVILQDGVVLLWRTSQSQSRQVLWIPFVGLPRVVMLDQPAELELERMGPITLLGFGDDQVLLVSWELGPSGQIVGRWLEVGPLRYNGVVPTSVGSPEAWLGTSSPPRAGRFLPFEIEGERLGVLVPDLGDVDAGLYVANGDTAGLVQERRLGAIGDGERRLVFGGPGAVGGQSRYRLVAQSPGLLHRDHDEIVEAIAAASEVSLHGEPLNWFFEPSASGSILGAGVSPRSGKEWRLLRGPHGQEDFSFVAVDGDLAYGVMQSGSVDSVIAGSLGVVAASKDGVPAALVQDTDFGTWHLWLDGSWPTWYYGRGPDFGGATIPQLAEQVPMPFGFLSGPSALGDRSFVVLSPSESGLSVWYVSLVSSSSGLYFAVDVTSDGANPGDGYHGVPDGLVTVTDLTYFIEAWNAHISVADITTLGANPGDGLYMVPDGVVDVTDLSTFVEVWLLHSSS